MFQKLEGEIMALKMQDQENKKINKVVLYYLIY